MVPWLMLASTLFSATSENAAGKATAAALRKNATAGLVTDRLRLRGAKLQQEAALSKIRANAGAAGVDIGQGSAMQAYLQTAKETELEIIMANKIADANFDATLSGAKLEQDAGGNKSLGSLLSGGADLYTYFTKKGTATFKPSVGTKSGGGTSPSTPVTLTKPGNLSVPAGYWGSR